MHISQQVRKCSNDIAIMFSSLTDISSATLFVKLLLYLIVDFYTSGIM